MTRLGEPSLHRGGPPAAPDPDGARAGLVPVVATGAALVATSFVVGGMFSVASATTGCASGSPSSSRWCCRRCPPALDDAATTRVAQAATQPSADSGVQVEPLAGDPDTPKQLSFNELSVRANAGNGQPTLKGRRLSLEGFVSENQDGAPTGTIRVGRYMIWCCAADATYGAAFVRWPAGTARLRPAPGSRS